MKVAAATLDVLRSGGPLAGKTGDASGRGLTPPYRVVYADRGQPDFDARLIGSDDLRALQVH